jgi:hypothetical protein
VASYLRGSEAAAIANAERAIAVANEPVYREFGRFTLANILAGFGRVEPAVVTVNACRQFAGTSGASFGRRCSSRRRPWCSSLLASSRKGSRDPLTQRRGQGSRPALARFTLPSPTLESRAGQ